MSKQPKFHIYEDQSGDWRWRLVAANGRIIADSAEGYTSKAGARRAANVMVNTIYEVEKEWPQ